MRRRLLFGVALLVLSLCALPVLAASPEPQVETAWAAIFAPAPPADIQPQAQEAAARGHLRVKSTTIAHCWDGSTVTCTGSSSSGVDSNCAAGQQGYCTGTDTGTINCPACPGCTATVTCANGHHVSCTGSSNCFSVTNCYANCDDMLYWCSPHPIPCPL